MEREASSLSLLVVVFELVQLLVLLLLFKHLELPSHMAGTVSRILLLVIG